MALGGKLVSLGRPDYTVPEEQGGRYKKTKNNVNALEYFLDRSHCTLTLHQLLKEDGGAGTLSARCFKNGGAGGGVSVH